MPLFWRIAIFCWSIMMLVLTGPMFMAQHRDVGDWCLTIAFALLFWTIGVGGIVFSLRFGRKLTSEETAPGAEKCAQLTVEYPRLMGGFARVLVNMADGTIDFQGCHTPRKFLGWPQRDYLCALNDLAAVHEYREVTRGGIMVTLQVVTKDGVAWVPQGATNYEHLRDLLSGVRGITPGPPEILGNGAPFVFAAMVGCLAGAFCLNLVFPAARSAGPYALFMAGGACLGVVGFYVTIAAAPRLLRQLLLRLRLVLRLLLRLRLAAPLGMSILGIVLSFGAWCLPLERGRFLLIMSICALLGFVVGLIVQKR